MVMVMGNKGMVARMICRVFPAGVQLHQWRHQPDNLGPGSILLLIVSFKADFFCPEDLKNNDWELCPGGNLGNGRHSRRRLWRGFVVRVHFLLVYFLLGWQGWSHHAQVSWWRLSGELAYEQTLPIGFPLWTCSGDYDDCDDYHVSFHYGSA